MRRVDTKKRLYRLKGFSAFVVILGLICGGCELELGTVNELGSRENSSADSYTLTYNGNGNTGGEAPATERYESGSTITVPGQGDLEKAGNEFIGWAATRSEDDRVVLREGDTFMITANMVLYAQWEDFSSGPGGIVPEGEGEAGSGGIVPHEGS